MDNKFIKPSIIYRGQTIYPTGSEWILAFALAGCKWAQDMLAQNLTKQKKLEKE